MYHYVHKNIKECSWNVLNQWKVSMYNDFWKIIIQLDAAHWWWLRRDPPMIVKSALGVQQYTIKCYINASFIHVILKSSGLPSHK